MDSSNGSRISLPPISSLIDGANDSSDNELSPQTAHARRVSADSPSASQGPEKRSIVGSPRNHLPPTPPLPPPSSFDFAPHPASNASHASPSTSSVPNTNYYGTAPSGPNSDPYGPRPSSYPPIPEIHQAPRTSAYPPIPDANQWPPSQPLGHRSAPSAYDPGLRVAQNPYPYPASNGPSYPGIRHQRPLPNNFPPPMPGNPMPPIDPQMAPTYHYHTAPAPVAYPQSQGAYICHFCGKGHSRPSSLKIHLKSHTGEKDFACERCGKCFNVMSNKRRHEKNCQGGGGRGGSGSGGPDGRSGGEGDRTPLAT